MGKSIYDYISIKKKFTITLLIKIYVANLNQDADAGKVNFKINVTYTVRGSTSNLHNFLQYSRDGRKRPIENLTERSHSVSY